MEAPSQLEQFLAGQTTEGEILETQAHFTIAKGEALRKIAEFQLPFENAWIVKIVQCAVAEATGQPIRVDFTSKEARLFFVTQSITPDDIESGFYDPEPKDNRALDHLLSALWTVALRLGWNFQFSLGGFEDSLIWDGENLVKVTKSDKHSCSYLAVSLNNSKGTLGWIKDIATAAGKHAELLKTLSRWCYICPVPLTVDGRRIDSIFNCPTHGPTKTAYPLLVGSVTELEPSFGMPPGSGRKENLLNDPRATKSVVTYLENTEAAGLDRGSKRMMQRLQLEDSVGAAYLLSTHWDWRGSGKHRKFVFATAYTKLYWVKDGAIVDEQNLLRDPTHCSGALFLSAQGLQTDLTSFHLAESDEREQRIATALDAVAEDLHCLTCLEDSLEDIVSGIKSQGRWFGGALFALGMMTIFGSPIHGVGLMIGGAAVGGGATKKAEDKENVLRGAVEKLRGELIKKSRQIKSR